MTEDETKRKIIFLYNTEYSVQSGGLENRNEVIGALPFYGWLQKNHPEVLGFPDEGDKYQTIKLWVGLP